MAKVARADGLHLHAEIDPLPFVRGGYGGQIGVRDDRIGRVRVAVASFSLDVPDFATQLGGNDDFHLRVRPSAALYVLSYLSPKRDGFAVGGSLRYLRLRYTHDAFDGASADTSYVQPWLGLSATVWRSDDAVVGDRTYDPLPLQAFFTVNLGWELVR